MVWTVKGEVENVEQFLMAEPFSFLQYISPQSGQAPKTRSLERKQQDPVVPTKWRHSTYLLDIIDKVSAEMLEIGRGGFTAVNTLPAHRGEGSFLLLYSDEGGSSLRRSSVQTAVVICLFTVAIVVTFL